MINTIQTALLYIIYIYNTIPYAKIFIIFLSYLAANMLIFYFLSLFGFRTFIPKYTNLFKFIMIRIKRLFIFIKE